MTKTKKKRKPSISRPSANSPKRVRTISYEITDEPIQDAYYRQLPDHVKEAVQRLHQESQTHPRKAIPELLALIEQYPRVPQFCNFLTVAYSAIGDTNKANATALATIRAHPDYLFGRMSYAELCLARREYAKIPEIFENKFDLKLLYPERTKFHITEAVNFAGLIGFYFFAIGNREVAEQYNAVLQQIGPQFPMAKRLQRALSPSLFARLGKRLTGS